jgi:hypothetical protein
MMRIIPSISTENIDVYFDTIDSKLFFYDVNSWQVNIYEMMRTILSISTENMDAYFDTIDSRLFFYENLLSMLYVVARTI